MSDRTCPRCRAQLSEPEVAELFSAIPEANREALLRRMTIRRGGALPRVGGFVEGRDGGIEFVPDRRGPLELDE